jgi:hypothetical protein
MDGEHHVGKGESRNYLECLDSRSGVEEGDLGNSMGDCLPNWYFPLRWGGGGGIWDKWFSGGFMEFLR